MMVNKTTKTGGRKTTAKQHILVAVTGNTPQIVTDTSEAKLELAQIPYVRLRNTLGSDVEMVENGLQELITIAQQRLNRTAPNRLVIDLPEQRARFGSQTVALRGVRLALLAYYADAKISRCVEPDLPVCGSCRKCFTNPVEDETRFQGFYKQLYAGLQPEDAPESKLDPDLLMSYHTKLNLALRSLSVKVGSQRKWGQTTYGLNLDKNLIEVIR
jgi:hypothetical protein